MKRTLLTQFLSLFSLISLAQPADILSIQNNNLVKEIDFISKDNKITADSTWSILSTWNNYP